MVEMSSNDAMSVLIYTSLMSHAKIPFTFFQKMCKPLMLNEQACTDMKELLQKARSYSLIKFAPAKRAGSNDRNGFSVHSVIQGELLRRMSEKEKERFVSDNCYPVITVTTVCRL